MLTSVGGEGDRNQCASKFLGQLLLYADGKRSPNSWKAIRALCYNYNAVGCNHNSDAFLKCGSCPFTEHGSEVDVGMAVKCHLPAGVHQMASIQTCLSHYHQTPLDQHEGCCKGH